MVTISFTGKVSSIHAEGMGNYDILLVSEASPELEVIIRTTVADAYGLKVGATCSVAVVVC